MPQGRNLPLRFVLGAIDKVTAPLKQVDAQVKNLKKPINDVNKRMRGMNRAMGVPRLRRDFRRLGRSASNFGRNVRGLAIRFAALGAGAGFALERIATSTANTAIELSRMARRSRSSMDALQDLELTLVQAGLSTEEASTMMSSLSSAMSQLRQQGSGPLIDAFGQLDPQFLGMIGQAQSLEEAFFLLNQRLQETQNMDVREVFAGAVGPAADALLDISDRLPESLADASEAFGDLGRFSQESTNSALQYRAAIGQLQIAFRRVRNEIGAEVLPVLQRLLGDVFHWMIDNQGQIRAFAEEVGRRLPEVVEKLIEVLQGLSRVLRPVGNLFVWVSESSTRVYSALLLLAGLAVAKTVASLVVFLAHLKMLVGSLTLVAIKVGVLSKVILPFGLLIFGVSKFIMDLHKHWDTLVEALSTDPFLPFKFLGDVLLRPVRLMGRLAQLVHDLSTDLRNLALSKAFQGLGAITSAVGGFFGDEEEDQPPARLHRSPAAQGPGRQQRANVNVRFDNLPEGARVESRSDRGFDFRLDTGMEGALIP